MYKFARTLPVLVSFGFFGVYSPVFADIQGQSYTLIETDTKTPETITKYVFNETTSKYEPKYYFVRLNKTQYGANPTDADFGKFYNFSLENGIEEGSEDNYNIVYWGKNEDREGDVIKLTSSDTLTLSDRNFANFSNTPIINSGDIGSIEGNFVENKETDSLGAIYNCGNISTIKGDFIENSTGSITNTGYIISGIRSPIGGAITNIGRIEAIEGNFIGNTSAKNGGAIYNRGYIGTIKGNFIQNNANYGGAIDNHSDIEIITGDFIGNSASNYGGAIVNDGNIKSIKGDFIGNSASNYGGAIVNDGNIESIKGDFTENTTQGAGGAVSNYGNINLIEGDFTENTTQYGGGAVANGYDSNIEVIKGDFIQNSASEYGGAVDNTGYMGTIEGNFSQNNVEWFGGGIANNGNIEVIKGNFSENYSSNYGGAIENRYVIGQIQGDFIKNHAESDGGAIDNYNEYADNTTSIESIKGNFTENSAGQYGGAIENYMSHIGNIEGDFTKNSAGVSGGAIVNSEYGIIDSIKGNFSENSAGQYGGAITNSGLNGFGLIEGNFIKNSAGLLGGAVFNYNVNKPVSELSTDDYASINSIDKARELMGVDIHFKNSSFVDNYVKSNDEMAAGGAVYNIGNIYIEAADGKSSTISGNYVEKNGVKESSGIYLSNEIPADESSESAPSSVVFDANSNGVIQINDKIISADRLDSNGDKLERGNKVIFTGDETGKILLNNSVEGGVESYLNGVNLYLGKDSYLQGSDMVFNSGSFNMVNGEVGSSAFRNFELLADTRTNADVDLYNESMDRVTAQNYKISPDVKLDVVGLNLLSDARGDETSILYADRELAGSVVYSGEKELAYSPLWKYDVTYNVLDDDKGYFHFSRGSAKSHESFNPSVLAAPVTANAGAFITQMQAFEYAFKHSDSFMAMPSFERVAIINADKYAQAAVTDVGVYSPLMTKLDTKGIWIKPYSTFENIPLKNGPKVSNISYGTLVGFDSNLKELKGGWQRVLTGYLGYNGASQRYSGIDTTQNGGLLGLTGTFYKNNFFNATTVSVGASVGSSSTMFGNEDFTMLMSGVGNKTGYNFEFKDGKYILQPSLFLSYTFINTFDYTSASGLRIKSDPLHSIQIAPGLKFFMNTKSGWQPYLRADMIWNLLDKSKVTAGDVVLPEMSIKPFVQYGVGVQKTFKDDTLTFFGQTLVQNGGRNGVSLNFGLRWAVGKR